MDFKTKSSRLLIYMFLLFLCNQTSYSENLDSILHVLDSCLAQKEYYESKYRRKSDSLRTLAQEEQDLQKRLIRWKEVLDFEFVRSSDKALYASEKVVDYAQSLNNISEEVNALQTQALVYGMGGLPWEGKIILDSLLENERLKPFVSKEIYTHYYNLYDYFYAYKLPDPIREKNALFLSKITNIVQQSITNPGIKAMTFDASAIGEERAIYHLKSLYERY